MINYMLYKNKQIFSILIVVFLLGMITFVGCAYFNSFYNARKNYREAEKQREDSPTQQQNTQKYNAVFKDIPTLSNLSAH